MRVAVMSGIFLVFERPDPLDFRMRVLYRSKGLGHVEHETGPVLMMCSHELDVFDPVVAGRFAVDRQIMRQAGGFDQRKTPPG